MDREVRASDASARLVVRRTMTVRSVILVLLGIAGVLLLARYVVRPLEVTDRTYLDLQVYRAGVQAWLEGVRSPYDGVLGGTGQLYTYPPVSLLLLAPFAALPLGAAVGLMLALSLAAAVGVAALSLRAVGVRGGALASLSLLLAGVATMSEPYWSTLVFGQVNALLVFVVLADLTWVRGRWKGLLTGAAAAVKLTPFAMVAFFVWRRDRPSLLRMLAAAGALTAVGFVVLPADSWRFFTTIHEDADRAGAPDNLANQSLRGAVARLLGDSPWGLAVWVLLCVVVVGLLVGALRRRPPRDGALAGERDLVAISLVVLAALLVSPVSWTHHWVWWVPVCVALLGSGSERWPLRAGGVVLAIAVFLATLLWSEGLTEQLAETLWNSAVVSNGYVLIAVYVLVAAALVAPREVPATDTTDDDPERSQGSSGPSQTQSGEVTTRDAPRRP